MADETFAIAMAIDTQTAAGGFGFVNGTIAALSGAGLDSSDGMLLGDKNSGDADSGIAIPNLVAVVRETAAVPLSFTETWDAYIRTSVEGFAVSFALQGNGADAGAPDQDAATPLVGVNAVLESVGMEIATGAADPDVDYTPTASTVYSTIKMWIGTHSFVFQDCIVETGSLVCTPGGNGIFTANFSVGSLNAFADDITFPTSIDYTTQASMAAPVIEGVANAWGATRGFETFTLNIGQAVEAFGDSNVVDTGQRQAQTGREITVDGRLYMTAAASSYEYDNLVSTTAPTDDLTFQVGDPDVGGAETALNAWKLTVANLSAQSLKYDKVGTAEVAELSGAKATGTTAGSEFTLTFN
jgi:hypothetical protein